MSRSAAPRVDVTRSAQIVVVAGGSGSGKSAWLKQQIAKDKRICAWDPDGEYGELPGFVTVTKMGELARTLAKTHNGRIAFSPPSLSAFDHWAKCVFAWGECTAVAEETADVTSPGKAPDGWGQLVRKGRKRGIRIYAVTQRPSESDKTVMGNRTLLHVCYLERAADRVYIAKELDCDPAVVAGIPFVENKRWGYLEKRRGNAQLVHGELKF